MDMDATFDRLTRRLASQTSRRAAIGATLAGLAAGALPTRIGARQATPGATPEPGEKPTLLFVQTATGGRGEINPGAGVADGTPAPGGGAPLLLTLHGHTGQTIYFSDRPHRIVGAMPTGPFFGALGFTPENPPNAALVGEFRTGQGVVVLELFAPAWDPDTGTLTYGADVLEGYAGEALEPAIPERVVERLPADFGPAALFIDSGAEMMVMVSGAPLSVTMTSYPPTQIEVCGFSNIPGVIGSPDDGTASLVQIFSGDIQYGAEHITGDCVTMTVWPSLGTLPSGEYLLEIREPARQSLVEIGWFSLP